jgi:threonine/homoserine/homoserine lactone efflux protein
MGTVLGLSAGLAPGPLLTLVISETLQHGTLSGVKVALAPLITDLPIIILTMFILSTLSNIHALLGIISLMGGIFILYMGRQNIRAKEVQLDMNGTPLTSISKGALANALNPHPYLFWISVGAPTMTKAMGHNIEAALAFIISFYFFLLGSKFCVAVLLGKSKLLMNATAYLYIVRLLGFVLCVLALVLIHDGLTLLKII